MGQAQVLRWAFACLNCLHLHEQERTAPEAAAQESEHKAGIVTDGATGSGLGLLLQQYGRQSSASEAAAEVNADQSPGTQPAHAAGAGEPEEGEAAAEHDPVEPAEAEPAAPATARSVDMMAAPPADEAAAVPADVAAVVAKTAAYIQVRPAPSAARCPCVLAAC